MLLFPRRRKSIFSSSILTLCLIYRPIARLLIPAQAGIQDYLLPILESRVGNWFADAVCFLYYLTQRPAEASASQLTSRRNGAGPPAIPVGWVLNPPSPLRKQESRFSLLPIQAPHVSKGVEYPVPAL